MKHFDSEYSQYDKNNTLGFALASMMFCDYTHIVVRYRDESGYYVCLGGSYSPVAIIGTHGSLPIESSRILSDGTLQITVKLS